MDTISGNTIDRRLSILNTDSLLSLATLFLRRKKNEFLLQRLNSRPNYLEAGHIISLGLSQQYVGHVLTEKKVK